ncbi:MAG: hypothetical protein KGL35_16195 [Bradyrhizobium sp.]|nr:hypothetical protein [Bradyrhizobium sp.]
MRSFKDPAAFARFLYEKTATLAEAEARGLDKVGAIVLKDAKARIGEYQDEVGPFPAWRDLAPSTIADKQAKGFSVPSPLERTGEMKDSLEFSRGSDRVTIGSAKPEALWQELGTSGPYPGPDGYHVPPRPFLGPALFTKTDECLRALAEEVAAWLASMRPNRW